MKKSLLRLTKYCGFFLAIFIITKWIGFSKESSIIVAIFSIALLALINKVDELKEAVEDLNLCIAEPSELEHRKEQAALAKCIREGIENKEICKGMSLEELHSYVNQRVSESYTFCPRSSDNKSAAATEERKTGKRKEIVVEHFAGVPTPGIYLYFEHGKLSKWKAEGYGDITSYKMKRAWKSKPT